jgi:TolA-binding protein
LFEAARAARGSGDVEGAVRSYAALLKQYPTDERAGVAALELGRLRMDSQHAYGPAADAFRRAIAAAPNEGVREDAMARLVEALDTMRDRDTCSKERQRYLARYPKGVHAAVVAGRCN